LKIYDYSPANWFTPEGVRKKRAQIYAKGLPNLRNWRFLTLTIDPREFETPLEAYQAGTERMRRFCEYVRNHFDGQFQGGILKQGNKLEFHGEHSDNEGWPHWHMVLNITRKLTVLEMEILGRLWGLGRVNVKRCKGKTLDYLFKYIFKCPVSGMAVPVWFADHYQDGKTFSRVRFWKTSVGFYTGRKKKSKPAKPQQTCVFPETVREKLERWNRTCVMRCVFLSGLLPLLIHPS